ncbi:MAG TPA: hypothetical protein VHX13_03270 [Acidobacteriaceae bacterium]|jgi:hypothetical protein|nr:hypothetical protein [Acidobacteriaceae bacterium]
MPRTLLALAVALAALPACAQQIPAIDVTTLSNGHVVLPAPNSIKPILIVIAFSAKGGDDSGAWNKRFQPAYTKDSRFDYLELADFQGIPPFIMKMIMHGMRRSVQEPEKSHLAPFYAGEAKWETLVGASNKKIAYALLADPSGHVVYQTHGPATDAKAAEVLYALAKLEHPPAR